MLTRSNEIIKQAYCSREQKYGLVECLLMEHRIHGKHGNAIESKLLDELQALDPEAYRYVLQEILYLTMQKMVRICRDCSNFLKTTAGWPEYGKMLPSWLPERIRDWQEHYGPFGHFRRTLPSFYIQRDLKKFVYGDDMDSITSVWDFTMNGEDSDPEEKVFVFAELQKCLDIRIEGNLQVRPEPVSCFSGNDHQIFTRTEYYEVWDRGQLAEFPVQHVELPVLKTSLPDSYLAILSGDLNIVHRYWSMGAYGAGYLPKEQGRHPVIEIEDDLRYTGGKEGMVNLRAVSNVITAALYRDDPGILRFLLMHFGKDQLAYRREMFYPLIYAKPENITLFLQYFDDIFDHLTQKDVLKSGRYELLKGYLDRRGSLEGESGAGDLRCCQHPGYDAADLLFWYRERRKCIISWDKSPFVSLFHSMDIQKNLNVNKEKNITTETIYVSRMESWMFHRTVFENAVSERLRIMALSQLFRLGIAEEGYPDDVNPWDGHLETQHLFFLETEEENAFGSGENPRHWYRILKKVREKYPCGMDITSLLTDHPGERGMLLCTFCEAAAAANEEWFYRVDIYDPGFLRTLRNVCLSLPESRQIIGCSRFFSVIRPTGLQPRPNRLTDDYIFRNDLFCDVDPVNPMGSLKSAIEHGYYGPENAGFQKFPEHVPKEMLVMIMEAMGQDRSVEEWCLSP